MEGATMNAILTVLDTTGIQQYVFGSNRLRENIGASELVDQATNIWPREIVRAIGSHNLLDDDGYDDSRRIEAGDLDAEIVYAGGGNTVMLFADISRAREFAGRYSRQLLQDAPGLEAVLTHQPIDLTVAWSLKDALNTAFRTLSLKKGTRLRSLPVLGLGVTAACQSTGMPANQYDQDGRAVSNPVMQKIMWSDRARERLKGLVKPITDCGLDIPANFDDFGRTRGEASYIAVVHADGNGMGRRFQAVIDDTPDNREAIQALRKLSIGVNEAGQRALHRVSETLLTMWEPKRRRLADKIAIGEFMPFRPLVFGGDDVTFVCDGRLGLTLSVTYLNEFEQAARACMPANSELGPATACAGIAIVKTHYPFARAYALAEGLCRNAKQYVRNETASSEQRSFSALDWHFATGGLYGDIGAIRAREYVAQWENTTGELVMRPVRLHDHGDEWRTWPRLERVITQFSEGDWKQKRNKVIGLREPLRQGQDAVRKYRDTYGLEPLPELSQQLPGLQETGWYGNRCGYFDAIEALDFYLKPTKGDA